MALSYDLLSQFAKITNDRNTKKTETSAYGTIVKYNNATYVKLDGSDLLTPFTSTITVNDGDRVTVKIKDHTITVIGSTTNPSASNKDVVENTNKINNFEIIVADKITTQDIEAINAYFESIKAISGSYEELAAITAEIETLQAKYAEMEHISATDVEIINAEIESLEAKFAEFTSISTEDLEAINAEFSNIKAYNADFTYVSAEMLKALSAEIEYLNVNKLDAESASVAFANIDFSNIGEAAIEKIFVDYGVIRKIEVSEGTFAKELIGVTIKGDLIEGNTIKADKLVVMGEDGLYYKLNIDGLDNINTSQASKFTLLETEPDNWETNYQEYYVINDDNYVHVTSDETPTWETDTYYKLSSTYESGLDGSVIVAESITAEKISVNDLVAFGATIGGFNISENSIYSGVKSSVDNNTRGVYIDNDGQVAFGDANNYLKYYKDEDGEYKLAISFGSTDLASAVEDVIKRTSYIDMGTDENGAPCIELGKIDNEPIAYFVARTMERVYDYDLGEYVQKWTYTATTEIVDTSSMFGYFDETEGLTLSDIPEEFDTDGKIYIYHAHQYDITGTYCYKVIPNKFKVRITNTAINFLENDVVVAYINNQSLYTEKIVVKNELQIGEGPGFVWKVRENGNMGLIYIE